MQLVRFARFIVLLRDANLEYSSAGAMVARQTSNLEAVGSSPTRNVQLFFLQNQIHNSPSTIITCFSFVPDLIILYFPHLTFFLSVRPGADDRRHHRVIQEILTTLPNSGGLLDFDGTNPRSCQTPGP